MTRTRFLSILTCSTIAVLAAGSARAEGTPPGWEVARMLGTVSALMPPAGDQVTSPVSDGEGGVGLVYAMRSQEAGITYTVALQSPLPAVLRTAAPAQLHEDLLQVETGALGGAGRNMAVPAGYAAAVEGWRDLPDQRFRFVRVFLDEGALVLVAAEGVPHPGAEAGIRSFADSVKLDHLRVPAAASKFDMGKIDLGPIAPPTPSLLQQIIAAAAAPAPVHVGVAPAAPTVPAPPPRLPDPARYAIGDVLLADASHAFLRQPQGWVPAPDFGQGHLFTLVQPPPPAFFTTGTIMLIGTDAYRLEQGQWFKLPDGQSAPLKTGFKLHRNGELVDLARLPNDIALFQELVGD